MSEKTITDNSSASDTPDGAVNGGDDTSTYDDIAAAANATHQEVIDKSVMTKEEEADLANVEVDDIFNDAIDGADVKLNRSKTSLVFSINDSLELPKKMDPSKFSYVVEMSSKAMKDAEESIIKEVDLCNAFETTFSSLAVPQELKGFDNKQTMTSFIEYLTDASAKLIDIGDVITANIHMLNLAEVKSKTNKDWLYANRMEWDDRNVAEIASMGRIASCCQSAIIRMRNELIDTKNQLSAIRIRSSDASEDMTELVTKYLESGFDVKSAKRAIINNNLLANLNKKHSDAMTLLIQEQKESDKIAFDNFTKKINDLNDAHGVAMAELRTEHADAMTKAREEFQVKLEDQAAKFAKILDTSNKKHKAEIAKLHVYYKNKISVIVAGYEKTISDLKVIIKDYSAKLEEANKLIQSYYTALDTSQKNQADLLSEYKQLASNRLDKVELNKSTAKTKNLNMDDAPVAEEEVTLTGSLAVNAEMAKVRQDEEEKKRLEEIEINKAKEEKDKENMKLAAAGLGALVLSGIAYSVIKGKKQSADDRTVNVDKALTHKDEK